MSKKIQKKKESVSLTPSTRKLIQMREGKGPGMLNEVEKDLLRKSAREISEACRHACESGLVPSYTGKLSGKTNQVTSLEEIENVMPDGWKKDEFDRQR